MTEVERVLMEAARNEASDEYFSARPQIDCNDRRKVFEAGFDRAWKQQQLTVCDFAVTTHPDQSKDVRCGCDQMMTALATPNDQIQGAEPLAAKAPSGMPG